MAPLRIVRWLQALLLAAMATAATAAVAPQSPAPDFTLRALAGPNLKLAEQRGRVVLVNFWATWCGPCREELPQLAKLHDKYRAAGLVLLGVNVDDDPRKAAELVTRLGLRFPVLLDTDKQVSRRYDMSAMPATVLIDRDGVVRSIHRGYRAGFEQRYDAEIRELLKE
jgi:peroxiredoxin